MRIPFLIRHGLAATALTMLLPALAHSAAAQRRLDDTTFVASWTLSNGMAVVTRDIPGAQGVAMTLGFGFGSGQDPRGREGWHQLLANVAFSSAAGEFPERALDHLDSMRPLGWRIEVGPRYTRLTEVAAATQFPGVLHEFSQRLRAPKPSAAVLAAAGKTVRAQLAANWRDRPGIALSYGVRGAGSPDADAFVERMASGKGTQNAKLAEVIQALASDYVPANAVLSLAGNLTGSGIDIERVLANEFGTIPAGVHLPPAPPDVIASGVRIATRSDIPVPVGVVGLIAPALSDTSHPSFYANALIAAASDANRWGRSAEVPSPFQYSLFDDPELARIFAPVTGSDVDSSRIREEYEESLLALSKSTITHDQYSDLHDSVLWMLGGPMPPELRRRARTDSGVLAALSTTAAMRQLWGGEAFWVNYLARYEAVDRPSFGSWSDYFRNPAHQTQLIFMPDWNRKKP